MAYKDLLVHLDSSARSGARMDLAVTLARRFGARLTGLFGESDPHVLIPAARDPEAALQQAAAAAQASFLAGTRAAGLAAEWQAAATVNDTELLKRLLFRARHADLAIVGQHDPQEAPVGVPPDLAEHLVLNSGRPTLVVPYAGTFPAADRVLVAWNGGREAARALGDALPFLAQASQVIVVAINPDFGRREYGEEPLGAIEQHLSAHGVRVETETLWVEDMHAMDILLARLTDHAIDLLVMGAHGHYGFPYLHRGSSTRHILRHMTVPVLMSH